MDKEITRQASQIFVHRTDIGYSVSPGTYIWHRSEQAPRLRNHARVEVRVTFEEIRLDVMLAPDADIALDGLDSLDGGVYRYRVVADPRDGFGIEAVGNSAPRIVVDP